MKKVLLNKTAIISGSIFATLNFIFPGYSFILCAINPARNFCGDAGMAVLINWPTVQILLWPFHLLNFQNEQLFLAIAALSGIIQYFIIGYLIGHGIIFMKNQIKRLFRTLHNAER